MEAKEAKAKEVIFDTDPFEAVSEFLQTKHQADKQAVEQYVPLVQSLKRSDLFFKVFMAFMGGSFAGIFIPVILASIGVESKPVLALVGIAITLVITVTAYVIVNRKPYELEQSFLKIIKDGEEQTATDIKRGKEDPRAFILQFLTMLRSQSAAPAFWLLNCRVRYELEIVKGSEVISGLIADLKATTPESGGVFNGVIERVYREHQTRLTKLSACKAGYQGYHTLIKNKIEALRNCADEYNNLSYASKVAMESSPEVHKDALDYVEKHRQRILTRASNIATDILKDIRSLALFLEANLPEIPTDLLTTQPDLALGDA